MREFHAEKYSGWPTWPQQGQTWQGQTSARLAGMLLHAGNSHNTPSHVGMAFWETSNHLITQASDVV